MSESLIPYSFIPGTKAKAQEVNANFIALADEIQGAQTATTEQINQLEESITDRIETVEENITNNCAGNDLSNTDSLTNTILAAPNGTVGYSGQTITVNHELKVLIPDGWTEDNKYKNIVYIVEEDISTAFTTLSNVDTTIFLYNDGTINTVKQNRIFYKNTTPTTVEDNVHWYNTDENKWYKYVSSSSEWQQVYALPVANASWNASNNISSFTASKALNIIKYSDLSDFYTIKGILPRELDYIVKKYKNGTEFYLLYKSGWVRQGGSTGGSGDTWVNFYVGFNGPYNVSVTRQSGAGTSGSEPCWIRDMQSTYMKIYSGDHTGKIWSAEGMSTAAEEI